MKTPVLAVLLSAAFLVASPSARADVETQLRGRAPLLPPAASPQPAATGFVEIRSRLSGERFQVEVANVDASMALEVFVQDATLVLVSAGTLAAGSTERMLVFDTADGDAFPAGANTITEFFGRTVQVRDTNAAVVLEGTVPAPSAFEDVRPAYGRSSLMRPEAGHGKRPYGSLRCWARPDGDEIRILARRLDGEEDFELFFEDEAGTMISYGTAESSRSGSLSFDIDTRDDDSLPVAAWSVHDLAGRRVEIREEDGGAVVLFGRIPPATRKALKLRAGAFVDDGDSDGRATVDTRIDYRSGRERLRIDLHKIAGGPGDVELWVDDGTGTFVLVADEKMKKSGRARFQWDNRKGDPLPLVVESLSELDGRAFEVRVEGVVSLEGTLPSP